MGLGNLLLLFFFVVSNFSVALAERKNQTVMVFGCFDLFHAGHRDFLKQASQLGNVIAIVSRDSTIRLLKKRDPVQSEQMRLDNVKNCPYISQAFLGDEILGEFSMLRKLEPDFIAIGYDQEKLSDYLIECMITGDLPPTPLVIMNSYLPEEYHTSLIRKKLAI